MQNPEKSPRPGIIRRFWEALKDPNALKEGPSTLEQSGLISKDNEYPPKKEL